MTYRTITRTTAVTATALAAGALTLLAAGTAGAASTPATIQWDNGSDHFTRTITDAAPTVGETVTVSTQIQRNSSATEQFDWVKDWHPDCLTYVSGSATMTDNSGAHSVEPNLQTNIPTYIAADFTATSYTMVASSTQTVTFSAQYTVGSGCAQGTPLTGGIEYLSSLGHSTFATEGPAITVTVAPTTVPTTTTAPVTTTTPATTTPTGTATGPSGDYGALLNEVLDFLGAGSAVNYHP